MSFKQLTVIIFNTLELLHLLLWMFVCKTVCPTSFPPTCQQCERSCSEDLFPPRLSSADTSALLLIFLQLAQPSNASPFPGPALPQQSGLHIHKKQYSTVPNSSTIKASNIFIFFKYQNCRLVQRLHQSLFTAQICLLHLIKGGCGKNDEQPIMSS